MTKIGVMVCGHGSRHEGAVTEFNQVAEGLKKRLPYPVESGFLEFATPIIRTGLDGLIDQGVDKILAIPGMLFAAGHAKNDIPSVLNTYAADKPDLELHYGRELGIDNKMIMAASARIEEACEKANKELGEISRHETMLVVVGRGASDPDANSNVTKVMRMLWEGMGFGWGETVYSGVTFPLVQPGLTHAARLGYKRIIVFPYFLFTGVLVNRIYDHTDEVAAENDHVQFIKAGYLNDHEFVLDTFADRVKEILEGTNNMNCLNCKYRSAVLGFETEVGAVQESHHHHVEGIGTGDQPDNPSHSHGHSHDHSHDHSHGHSHDHDVPHTHTPYPQADHPHGPYSLKGTEDGEHTICPCGRWRCKTA